MRNAILLTMSAAMVWAQQSASPDPAPPGRQLESAFERLEAALTGRAALAAELAGRRVAVIVTIGATAAALAAQRATSTTPIVFAIGADPVKFGLVASLNSPGGNITGVSFLSNVLVAKQLELLQELVPTAIDIGLLVNPGNPNAESDVKVALAAAQVLRSQIHVARASTEGDFDAAFASLVQQRSTAFLVAPDLLFANRPD